MDRKHVTHLPEVGRVMDTFLMEPHGQAHGP